MGRGPAAGGEQESPRQRIDRSFPDPKQGLSAAQAARLLANGYGNEAVSSNAKSTRQIVRENTLTFFNLVFVVLAVLLVLAGNFRDMFFLVLAAINSLIGIVQQLRSRATLEKLNLIAQGRVKVLRDGQLGTVPLNKLVREDIVELGAGDQIPADGPVMSGQVTVNEALITGEADPITKNPGDQLLSGSFVVSGKCRARMDHVGAESYASRLALKAKADQGVGKSQMMQSLDRLIRVIGFALIPIGVALFWNEFVVQEGTFSSSVTSVVAALTGMIPEGLYLLTSVALAVSVMRLAQRKTLVHEMSAIETLARVDVLCVDKTGTITQPEMSVREVVCLDEEDYPAGKVEDIFNAYYRVMDADNDTARAMAQRFSKSSPWQAERIVPFTSANKWSAVVFRGHGSYVVGAPEFILGGEYKLIQPMVAPYQAQGCRVLLLARCHTPPTAQGLSGMIDPVALAVLANPVRPEAPDTFRYFAQQGVRIKVISGDNPETVSQVARQAGIQGAERFVDAAELRQPEDYAQAVREYTVFGRVTPDQKRKLVQALQQAGHTVAMTGDGVNDVLALKDADCGIAMASGSDAACHAAQLVLLNSDFSAMPKVVAEGRRVINNIQRAAALYLVKNIFSFLLAVISLFATFPYPVTPLQLSFLSAITIGVPSFFLALEPNHSLVKGKFLANVFRSALPGGLTDLFVVLGVEAFYLTFAFTETELSTMSAILLVVIGILVLYEVCKPFDWKRRVLWGAMAGSGLVCILWFGESFGLSQLSLEAFLVLLVFLGAAYAIMRLMLTLFNGGQALWERLLGLGRGRGRHGGKER